MGVTANLEAAAKEARGELIALLADDDSIEPGNYERKVAILEAYPEIGFVYSLAYATDENLLNPQVLRRPEYLDHSYIGGRAEFTDLISGNYIYAPGVMFRRSLIEEHGVMDRNLPPAAYPLSDWDLWLRFTFHTETAFINEPLVNVRFHGSALSLHSSDMAMGMIAVWHKWLVDRHEPPPLDRRTWERMQAVFFSEVQRLHASDPPKSQACLAAFEELRVTAMANASRAFACRTRGLATRPRPEPRTAASVVWTGPVWGAAGMGSDLRGMAAAAETVPAISLRLEDLNWGLLALEPKPGERRMQLTDSLWRPLPAGNNHIYVWHGPLEHFRPDAAARVSVARVAFGNEAPSPRMLEKSVELEALWVPSQFHCDVLLEYGIPQEKLRVLPSCVGGGNGAAGDPVDLGTGRHFNFTSMVRLADSGLEVLVRAFVREFRPDEDVALVLVVRMPPGKTTDQLLEEILALVQREVGTAKRDVASINLRVAPLPEDALTALLRASQAYVEPRPSTWGRGVLEAMACGVPVVGARIGPNIELLSPHNSFASASETTTESLGELMRQAYATPEETRRRGVRARTDVAAKHSPPVVGERLRDLVDELRM
jgi:glycosyltransferase involved in cell wall biosynthesis